jgi:XTP/dITP diphosphohydrolase
MDLFFGTTNPGKLRELRRLVAGLPVRVVSPAELGRPAPEVEEDGRTFAENAAKKAAAFARFAGMMALADDSGLCVDALGGAPGVRSARWADEEPGVEPASPVCDLPGVGAAELGEVAGRAARDERNNDKLLRALAGVPDARRGAEYQAVLALARADGTIVQSVTSNYERVETASSFYWADSILDPNVPVASLPLSIWLIWKLGISSKPCSRTTSSRFSYSARGIRFGVAASAMASMPAPGSVFTPRQNVLGWSCPAIRRR